MTDSLSHIHKTKTHHSCKHQLHFTVTPSNGTISTLDLYFLMASFNWSTFISLEQSEKPLHIQQQANREHGEKRTSKKVFFKGGLSGSLCCKRREVFSMKLKVFSGLVQGWGSDAVNNSGICIQISSTFRLGLDSRCRLIYIIVLFHAYLQWSSNSVHEGNACI